MGQREGLFKGLASFNALWSEKERGRGKRDVTGYTMN